MTQLLPLALGILLQSTVSIALGLLALHFTRRHGPVLQSWISRATLTSTVLLMVFSAPLSRSVPALWHISELTPAQAPVRPEAGRVSGGDTRSLNNITQTANTKAMASIPGADNNIYGTTIETGAASGAPTLRDAPSPSSRLGSSPISDANKAVGLLWPLGTAALLLWLGVCQSHLARLRCTAMTLTSGPAFEILASLTSCLPPLLTHPAVRSPFLAGLRRPTIYLPTEYETEFGPTALRAILAHELAHRDRRDTAWTLAARLLCAALWFQPLLWLFCRRLEQISEEACDQAVLAHHCPSRAYADCLLTLAERHPVGRRERALGAGVAPFRSSLSRRITRILDKGTPTMSAVSTPLRLIIAAGAIAGMLGGIFAVPSTPAQTLHRTPQKVASPQPTSVAPSLIDPRKATLAALDAKIKSAQNRRGNSMRALIDFKRTFTHNTRSHKVRLAVLSQDFALDNELLNSLMKARTDAASDTKAHSESISPISRRNAQFLAGLTPVQGPGIVITLRDSKTPLPNAMPIGITPPNLIHDTDINQVVNELKAAGAEAIAVNNQRLILTSAVRDIGHTIVVNHVVQAPPYVIRAIGNGHTLMNAINQNGGIAMQIRYFDKSMISVQKAETLDLPAYSGESGPRYAKPVTLASFDTDRAQTLIHKRDQLAAQLNALNEQADSLNAQLQHIISEANQAVKKLPPPLPKFDEQTRLRRDALSRELTNALADLQQKRATLAPDNPAIWSAKAKIQAIKYECQHQHISIAEKQKFIKEVHQYNRQTVAIFNTAANKGRNTALQLNDIKKQQHYLQAAINLLNRQVASEKKS